MTKSTTPTPTDLALSERDIAILIANTSIDATYADCDYFDNPDTPDTPELDDDWHAKIGMAVIAALAAKGLTIVGPGQAMDQPPWRGLDGHLHQWTWHRDRSMSCPLCGARARFVVEAALSGPTTADQPADGNQPGGEDDSE